MRLGWDDLHAIRPIEFGLATDVKRQRTFRATIYDTAARPATAEVKLELDCGARSGACAGDCTPLDSTADCGTCDNTCGARASCVAATGGAFACACPTNQAFCGGRDCVSLAASPNCGTCGRACTGGAVCVASGTTYACECPVNQILCGGTCVPVYSSNNCGACGNVCSGGTGCTSSATGYSCQCGPDSTLCNGRCIELKQPDNCGSCGNVCTSAQKCVEVNWSNHACVTAYDVTAPEQKINFSGANYFKFTNLPVPPTGVRAKIEVSAAGDFDGATSRTATVGIEGGLLGTFPNATGSTCNFYWRDDYYDSDIRYAIVGPVGNPGEVTISFDASSSVRQFQCSDVVKVRLVYPW